MKWSSRLLAIAAIGFLNKGRGSKRVPKLAEAAALLALVAALVSVAGMLFNGPGRLVIGLQSVGLSDGNPRVARP